ncbi:MAG: hypothetical protein ABII23_03405 [bacterium]
MKNKLVITLLTVCLGSLPICAGSNPAAYLKAGVGARALGMGGAFTSIADDPSAAYWNPAGLGTINRLAVSTMVQNLGSVDYPSLEDVAPDYQYAAVVMPLHKAGLLNLGTVGVSWISNSLDNIPWTTVDGSGQIQQSSFNDSENAYIISYGQSFIDRDFYAGVNLKYLNQTFSNINDASAAGYGLEGGVLYRLDSRLSIGLVIDSGIKMKWSNGHQDQGSIRNKCGASCKIVNQNRLSVLVAADLIQTRNRPLDAHLGSEFTYKLALGNEAVMFKKLSLRLGVDGLALENKYNNQGIMNEDIKWTMGTGFTFAIMNQDLGIDYSFGSYRTGALHRLSFAFMFL